MSYYTDVTIRIRTRDGGAPSSDTIAQIRSEIEAASIAKLFTPQPGYPNILATEISVKWYGMGEHLLAIVERYPWVRFDVLMFGEDRRYHLQVVAGKKAFEVEGFDVFEITQYLDRYHRR